MREPARVSQAIEQIKFQFKNSPYIWNEQFESSLGTKDTKLMTAIIPARNEFPNIVHTIYSIIHCWEADGFDPKELEIIIIDNASDEYNDPRHNWKKPGDRGTVTYLMPRGMFYSGTIRVIYDPIAGNHTARNKGALAARGKYLFFSDAHMAYRPGFFKKILDTVDATGGIAHGAIGWMGAYPPHDSGVGCQYTIKLGEEIKGTWNNYRPWSDDWFYIPALGHCSLAVRRDQFLEFQGYPGMYNTREHLTAYGGGEFYLNMKWWMFGSTVAVHPEAIGYHLASGRGYVYHHDGYVRNVLAMSYALGLDDWRERAYLNWMRNGRKEVLDKMMADTAEEMAENRQFVFSKVKTIFNDLIIKRPWDILNMERRGAKNSSMLIFHDTWLDLIKEHKFVREAYENSKYQKPLEDFINNNLSDFVYKRVKK